MKTRILLHFIWLLGLAATIGSAAAQEPTKVKTKIKTKPVVTTVYIVRHAEKDSASNPADPTLSAVGQVRAQALRQLLVRRQPAALFTTNTTRTPRYAGPSGRSPENGVAGIRPGSGPRPGRPHQ